VKRKGQATKSVISFLVFAVMIMVTIVIFSNFDTTASSLSMTTSAAASRDNVTVNTYSAFNLVAVGPIILGAAIVLGIVAMLGRR
jgi:hypothetical protein